MVTLSRKESSMVLREELERQGNWLFRWRSFLPLLILPILFFALRESVHCERVLGDTIREIFTGFSVGISLLGLAVRCLVIGYAPKGTSGRNTQGQIAQTLNTLGMYSLIRHPLYLGNFLIFSGLVLYVEVWWFTLIAVLAFWLYYERIMFAEEEFLHKKFGDFFLEWANKTPAFFPKFKNWEQPSLPFSLKNVIRREYQGLFVLVISFTLLDIGKDSIAAGAMESDLIWGILSAACVILYIVVTILKKKTKILDVEGR